MKLRVKPFTLFLYMAIILFLILGTHFIFLKKELSADMDLIIQEEPTWKGIITLWDISYVDVGTGSRSEWLNNWVKNFEKQNPGIFIDVRRMTPQRVKAYFSSDINEDYLPDIISLNNYEQTVPINMLEDLTSFFTKEELSRFYIAAYQRVEDEGKIYGVPWMMGAYALVLNQDMVEEKGFILDEASIDYESLGKIIEGLAYVKETGKTKEIIYGFCSYDTEHSRPLVSMNYAGGGKILNTWTSKEEIAPENIWNLDKREAYDLFLGQKSGAVLGGTDIIFRARAMQEQGNGFRIKVVPLNGTEKLLQDQISAFGIIKQQNSEKLKYCVEFLKLLISKEVQAEIKQLGMFPVVNDVGEIYSDDPEMNELEKKVPMYRWGPDDQRWNNMLKNHRKEE